MGWNRRIGHNDLLDRPLLRGWSGRGPAFEQYRVFYYVKRERNVRCGAHSEIDSRLPVVDRPCRKKKRKPDADELMISHIHTFALGFFITLVKAPTIAADIRELVLYGPHLS